MKILITGGGGQLGPDCRSVLKDKHELISMDLHKGPHSDGLLDITDDNNVENVIGGNAPDIVINCAAYTHVDRSETEEEHAMKVNGEGPKNLAVALNRYGGKLIHISTDYVFNGRRPSGEAYVETDRTDPVSAYGRTKLAGELAIADNMERYAIVRTAWLYGFNGHNFLKTILRLAIEREGQKLKVVNDQFGSPTWTYRLAEQIERLIETDGRGIYHGTAEGSCTWYDLATYFLDVMGVPHNIVPCGTEEYPTPAIRPRNSVLENDHLKRENINLMVNWRDDIDRFVERYKEQLVDEISGVKR